MLSETSAGALAGVVGTFVDVTPAIDAAIRAGRPLAALAHNRRILVTLEVFDTATGQTAFTTPFAAVGFNPQPELVARDFWSSSGHARGMTASR